MFASPWPFGLGIDKPTLRLVVLWAPAGRTPPSVSGSPAQAGRDTFGDQGDRAVEAVSTGKATSFLHQISHSLRRIAPFPSFPRRKSTARPLLRDESHLERIKEVLCDGSS